DARVVSDDHRAVALVERHVEIHAHEAALPGYVNVADAFLGHKNRDADELRARGKRQALWCVEWDRRPRLSESDRRPRLSRLKDRRGRLSHSDRLGSLSHSSRLAARRAPAFLAPC